MSTALALPGWVAPQVVKGTGIDELELCFVAMLEAESVPMVVMDILGDKGFNTVSIFGGMKDEQRFESFCKKILNIDPDAGDNHFLVLVKLHTVWGGCKTRATIKSQGRR